MLFGRKPRWSPAVRTLHRKAALRRILECIGALSILATSAASGGEPPGRPLDDYLLIPLRVHLLAAADEPSVATTLSEQDIERILNKINGVWSQARVHFWLESLLHEVAVDSAGFAKAEQRRPGSRLLGLRPDPGKTDRTLHLYYLKSMTSNGIHFPSAMFVKDTAELRKVPGGIDEPLPRVSSHEIGHALGLPHRQDTTNLMASGTTGTTLNDAEIETARATARKLTCTRSAGSTLQEADAAWEASDKQKAIKLYRRLAMIPASGEEATRAQQRSAMLEDQ